MCVNDRVCLLGRIAKGAMILNDAGKMVDEWWKTLPDKFPNIELDEYVVMPNHVHGIIIIAVGADLRVCPDTTGEHAAGTHTGAIHTGATHTGGAHPKGAHTGAPLHRMVQWFKTMTTNEYIRGVKPSGWTPFNGKLWQRNYYEHIIRNERDYLRIREYIYNNPLQWHIDAENPEYKKAK